MKYLGPGSAGTNSPTLPALGPVEAAAQVFRAIQKSAGSCPDLPFVKPINLITEKTLTSGNVQIGGCLVSS
jgi:hypothetical protein